jgi:hypothetical protein
LQAALNEAFKAGVIERPNVVKAYVRLAARRHDHLRLDAVILRDAYDRCSDTNLTEFEVLTHFIGGKHADMRSHTMVAGQFLAGLWKQNVVSLKVQAATGMLLKKLLRSRKEDWFVWLALVLFVGGNAFVRYVADWLRGHFLPPGVVLEAYRHWETQIARPRTRLADHVSATALHIGGAI